MSALRDTHLRRLAEGVHDVLCVGAGINGAASAAALAARGARIALVDRGDFAGLTSQESSNLVWGGIKYLENGEFRLVRKLCRSRNELIRAYPANVTEIRFFAPIERRWMGLRRTLPVLWVGAWLYWLMGGCFTRAPRWLTPGRIAREEPKVNVAIMRGGLEYSDAYLLDNDARFVFGFVRDAIAHGASAANYVEVLGSARDADGVWIVRARDRVAGRDLTLRSRVLLNAAGPYVDRLNEADGIATETRHVFSKGIHLIVGRLARRDHVLTFFDDTNRMFFVIPMGHRSVIGTTDTRVEAPEARVTDADREFLLRNLNERLRLDPPLGERDVIAERCGVRPLAVARSAGTDGVEWVALSRKHVIEVDAERGHVSIFGGKLTDCLNVGDSIVEEVEALGVRLPRARGRWYGEPPAERRATFLAEARRVGLDDRADEPEYEPLSRRLWRRYGEGAFAMLEQVARDPRMGEPVIEGAEYRRCELLHAARAEMVVRLEDFLRRRSKIAQVTRAADLRAARGLLEACEILFAGDARARLDEYFSEASP